MTSASRKDTTIDLAGSTTLPAMVKVWDPLVRIFHWSLLILFVVAIATGDEIESVHIVAGYGIASLLAFRIVWGIVGPRYARFADFVPSPRSLVAYIGRLASLRAERHLGHNPAGGAMIVALLIMLGVTCATGYLMTLDKFWGSGAVEEVHEFLAYATLALVALHVAGVVVSSAMHRENLVRSMITGWKRAG